jgi:phosphatidylinositol alpha-mannosyltransferase
MGVEPVVIPNGIFCEDFASAESRPEDGDDGPTIVFVGRTDEPRKGLPVLLAAFAQVAAVHPTVRLLIAGRGPHAASPTGSRPSRISYLGMVSDAEKARLLASATVYVAPHVGGESSAWCSSSDGGRCGCCRQRPAGISGCPRRRPAGCLVPVGDAAAAASSILGMLGDAGHRDRVRAAARIEPRDTTGQS